MKFPVFLLMSLLIAGSFAYGVDFESVTSGGKKYTVCHVNLQHEKLRLFLKDNEGKSLKSFDAVQSMLASQNQKLLFAMNAGMYETDFSPLGLYIADGRTARSLNMRASTWGNFYLKPNGVFYINEAGAHITETSQYVATGYATLATQSGPMLVIDGRIHSAFNPDSQSRLFRNGVGVVTPQEVVFVISEEPVNFYEFALLFRDVLHCRNALFLDGTISSLYSAELKRDDRKMDLGPMIGVVSGR
jgi:uncharacterized protein YigE (DUF2233 family)